MFFVLERELQADHYYDLGRAAYCTVDGVVICVLNALGTFPCHPSIVTEATALISMFVQRPSSSSWPGLSQARSPLNFDIMIITTQYFESSMSASGEVSHRGTRTRTRTFDDQVSLAFVSSGNYRLIPMQHVRRLPASLASQRNPRACIQPHYNGSQTCSVRQNDSESESDVGKSLPL